MHTHTHIHIHKHTHTHTAILARVLAFRFKLSHAKRIANSFVKHVPNPHDTFLASAFAFSSAAFFCLASPKPEREELLGLQQATEHPTSVKQCVLGQFGPKCWLLCLLGPSLREPALESNPHRPLEYDLSKLTNAAKPTLGKALAALLHK